jgi:hypothetical protein
MTSEERTVRVRVAVVVEEDGSWGASGWDRREAMTQSGHDSGIIQEARSSLIGSTQRQQVVFLEADLPLPTAPTVEAEVKP